MLRFAGYLLLILSLLSALALVASPFDVPVVRATGATWLLFPVTLCIGFLFAALGAKPGTIGRLFRIVGGALMGLGCTAALLLVAGSIGVIAARGSMAPVWFILIAGFFLGALGLSAKGQR
jgi:hypothetical protein